MAGSRLAQKALSGRLSTDGPTGEIVRKAAITTCKANELSGLRRHKRGTQMNRYYIAHLTITALGFLMGAMLAMMIAPGDTLVLIGTGIVFGFFARKLFDQDFGGDWFWPFGQPAGRKILAAKPTIGQR
jgi:hypothetical protein